MRSSVALVLMEYAKTNMDKTLEEVIQEQSLFEDSALEDACAYARMINKGSERFKLKEKQDDPRSQSKEASQEDT